MEPSLDFERIASFLASREYIPCVRILQARRSADILIVCIPAQSRVRQPRRIVPGSVCAFHPVARSCFRPPALGGRYGSSPSKCRRSAGAEEPLGARRPRLTRGYHKNGAALDPHSRHARGASRDGRVWMVPRHCQSKGRFHQGYTLESRICPVKRVRSSQANLK
jgi:hypothetical protein